MKYLKTLSLKKMAVGLPLLLILSVAGCLALTHTTNAQVQNWNAGNIIADGVFTDTTTMTPQTIQAFLNSKVPTCDTQGAQTSEYGGGTRAQWAAAHNYYPPFTCLKDYTENGLSSAQIIYNVSQQYSINPQVLLVLLQKEQGLVTDTWPVTGEYRTATGYGCPDTSACDTQYYGFTNQVTWAAKMYHAIETASPTWYTPYVLGNNSILYNPSTSCGSSTVNIQNRATQALYNYTPYQPNAAALAADFGSGDSCSSYGNRNFYEYFTSWFGSTQIQVVSPFLDEYTALGGTSGVLGKATMNQVCGIRENGCYQGFQNGNAAMYWSQNTGAHTIWGGIYTYWRGTGSEWGAYGLPTSDETYTSTGSQQNFENGTIYWNSTTNAVYGISNQAMATEYNAYPTVLKTAVNNTTCGIKYNGCYQVFQNGGAAMYWSQNTGAHTIWGGIFPFWRNSGSEWGTYGLPTSDEMYTSTGSQQNFENGTIYWNSANNTVFGISNTAMANEYNANASILKLAQGPTYCGIKYNGCYQFFQNGHAAIYWSQTTGAHEIWGGMFPYWRNSGSEWGSLGLPTSDEMYTSTGSQQTFENGTLHWSPTSGVSQ